MIRWGILLLLFVPGVSASWSATEEGGYQTYNLDTYANHRDNPASGQIFSRSITVNPGHDFAVETSYAVLQIAYTAKTATTATGVWLYTTTWDGVALNCIWAVETTGTITNTGVYPFENVWCRIENSALTAGSHTLVATRSTGSGTPAAIDHETISYTLERTDLLEPNTVNDLLEAFNSLAPLLLFLLVVIWAEITREPLVYALAVVVGGIAVVAIWSEIASLRLALIGVITLVAMRGYLAYGETMQEKQDA